MSNPEVTLKMTPAGAELIVQTLRRATPLPDANIDAFIGELWAQYQAQAKAFMEAQQKAAEAANASAPADGSTAPADAPTAPAGAAAEGGAE
jgi:hypothetical protein